jgi:Bifunctional DNA primase/polymerase, N-terminal
MNPLHDTTGAGKPDDALPGRIERLRAIFGESAVLLPCAEKIPLGKSGRKLTGWQKLTAAMMSDAAWLAELRSKPQVGVRCGDGLLCIDLDEADALAAFRVALPSGVRTTVTLGQPGRAKYFFRVAPGTCGRKRYLYRHDRKIGELLANGSQAIIAGVHHETGQPYTLDDDSPPMETTVEQIEAWLEVAGVSFTGRRGRGQRSKCGVGAGTVEGEDEVPACRENFLPPPPPSFPDKNMVAVEILARVKADQRAGERLAAYPVTMQKLYRDHVEREWPARPGQRNQFIVDAIPALLRRVAPAVAVRLAGVWYELHRELFEDSRETHEYEAGEHCANCLHSYRLALGECEGAIYDALGERGQAAFRIARDLARCPSRAKPPCFPLSEQELAVRLAIHPEEARRLLAKLHTLGLIEIEAKGKPRALDNLGLPRIDGYPVGVR